MKQLNICNLLLAASLLSLSSLANAGVSHFGSLQESHNEKSFKSSEHKDTQNESRFKSSEHKDSQKENSFKKPEFKESFSKVAEQDSKEREHRKEHDTVTSPVPEPETYAMILAGLFLVGFSVRRRNRQDN